MYSPIIIKGSKEEFSARGARQILSRSRVQVHNPESANSPEAELLVGGRRSSVVGRTKEHARWMTVSFDGNDGQSPRRNFHLLDGLLVLIPPVRRFYRVSYAKGSRPSRKHTAS